MVGRWVSASRIGADFDAIADALDVLVDDRVVHVACPGRTEARIVHVALGMVSRNLANDLGVAAGMTPEAADDRACEIADDPETHAAASS